MTVSEVDQQAQTDLTARMAALEARLEQLEASQPDDKVAIVIFSGDLDKVLASFVIATGAAALGQEVSMFFTFWGLSAIKRKSVLDGKNLFEKMMAVMSPSSSTELPVSQMNYFGIGAKMLRKMMADRKSVV